MDAKTLSGLLIALACVGISNQSTPAQNNPWRDDPKRITNTQRPEKLTKPAELPGMPPFTGSQKFIRGTMAVHVGTGIINYQEFFSSTDYTVPIYNFYVSALQTYGWIIDSKDPSGVINAHDNSGNRCCFSITPANDGRHQTMVALLYQQKIGR